MTPRQVIIVGSMLRALFYRTEYLEQKASSPSTDKSLADRKAHAALMEEIAARYLARYAKKANQASEPTAPSGRGSP